jgi:phosphate:Na+ symporter
MINSIFTREGAIDGMVKVARESHLIRFYCGICHADAGPFFVETLLHLERISDLCQNVAEYVDELQEN